MHSGHDTTSESANATSTLYNHATYHVGRDRALHVAETHDHAERDAALVRSLNVARHPRNEVRNRRVHATRGEVAREVRQSRASRTNQDNEAAAAEDEAAARPMFMLACAGPWCEGLGVIHVEIASAAITIGEIPN